MGYKPRESTLIALIEKTAQSFKDESPDTQLTVRKLIRTVTSKGFPRKKVLQLAAQYCEAPSVQNQWVNWAEIDDREELKLRLELMYRFDSLIPGLHDFIMFFFRASDPVMYQTAALVLGKHLPNHPPLEEYLLDYMQRRTISPGQPVKLNGERSRRRVLICLASLFASDPARAEKSGFTFPVDPDLDKTGKGLSPADVNSVLIAVSALLKSGLKDETFEQFAFELLQWTAGQKFSLTSGNLARNWGQTLSRVSKPGPDSVTDLYCRQIRQILQEDREPGRDDFNDILLRYSQVDEILISFPDISPEFQHRILEEITSQFESVETDLIMLRIASWELRMSGQLHELSKKSIQNLSSRADSPEAASNLLASAAKTFLQIERELSEEHFTPDVYFSLFTRCAERLENKLVWLKTGLSERLFLTLFLKNVCQYELDENRKVSSLLNSFEQGQHQKISSSGTLPNALNIILLIQMREESEFSLPADSNLIHQIPDPDTLLALIPESKNVELIAVLADALEHHLRLQLIRDPDFSLPVYLFKIAARKPHPHLFDLLAQTCKDRVYSDPRGSQVPVYEMVTHYLHEARLSADQVMEKTQWPLPEIDMYSDRPGSEFHHDLITVRNDLVNLGATEDLTESLNRFADLMDPGLVESETGSSGICDLITETSCKASRDSGPDKDEIKERISSLLVPYREKVKQITPVSFEYLPLVKEASYSLKEYLRQFEELILPMVTHVEAKLFQYSIRAIAEKLDIWVQSIDKANVVYRTLEPEIKIGKSNWESLFNLVTPLPTDPMKNHLLQILYHSLFSRAGRSQNPDTSWTGRHNFLKSAGHSSYKKALDSNQIDKWESLITEGWSRLTREAMEANYETRVQNIMQEPVFSFVYRSPAVSDLVLTVRSWFYDRFNVMFTHTLSKQTKDSAFNVKRELLTLRSYIQHFTHMWVALVIGAILMLDFGDAWTALAEIGDIKGVIITFMVGVVATGIYLYVDLKGKTRVAPEDSRWERNVSYWLRIGQFLVISLLYTLAITSLLWLLFSSTDEVVHGPEAILHIFGWTGFALLIGIFFGLLSRP